MKKIYGALFSALLFMFLLSSLAVPAFAFTPTAEAPEWNEGDRWAFGADRDVGTEFDEILTNLTNLLEGVEQVESVNEMSVTGGAEFWMLFEVTEVTDDEYVMDMDMATAVDLNAALSVTADLPEEGTYNYSDDPDTVELTVEAEVDVDLSLVVNVEMTYDRDTMAVKTIAVDLKLRGDVDFVASNLPQNDDDWMNSTETWEYVDYDVHGELVLNFDMELEFDPGLNLYDFPLAMDEVWWSNFTASFSGHLTGYLDIEGLPEEMEENIFSEEFVDQIGFSEFPIVFEEIDADGTPLDDGVIEPFTIPDEIQMRMRCTDYFILNDDFHGEIGVYEIQVGSGDSPLFIYYSDEVGFMASMAMDTEEMDLPDGFVTADMTTMSAVNPDEAEDNIAEIADRQAEIDEEDGGMLGFFTDPPYLGIILVAVIVVVVVAAVFLIRKK